MKSRKPSTAGMIILRRLATGLEPAGILRRRADYGGYESTMMALRRHGWIDDNRAITDAGRRFVTPQEAP